MEDTGSVIEEAFQLPQSQPASILEVPTTSPLSRTVTESSESTHTLRGAEHPRSPGEPLRTPSYPFPLTAGDMGTPAGTPGTHLPFTALSPTIPPMASTKKSAKGDMPKEVMASGRMHQSPPGGQPSEPFSDGKPNLFEIAVQIQSEPGLAGWWKQTVQVLRGTFQAQRATLSVPSDRTEIENLPWAQLASFNNEDDEMYSQIALDSVSTPSSLSEVLWQDSSTGENRKERETIGNLWPSPYVGPAALASRPKLESRHSYAGYSPKYHAIRPETTSSPAITKRPGPSRTTSQASVGTSRIRGTGELTPEQSKHYDSTHGRGSPVSDDTSLSNSGLHGRILDVMQPLDSEVDPLITPAGIVRVLNNSRATVLTRKYLDPRADAKPSAAASGATSHVKKSSLSQQHSSDALSKPKHPARQRSNAASNTGGSTAQSKVGEIRPYEDFEQVPGTPWAQSPAPSPAAAPDPEENPFFADTSAVKEAFMKHPPTHRYGRSGQITAIGLDRSRSVLHVPLVHPSAKLSQPQRAHRLREDRNSRDTKAFKTSSRRHASSERKRKVPLAVLSILTPSIPYPAELVEALNQLSPIFATSFYAAKQHTNLQTEVFGLAQIRARSGGRPYVRDEKVSDYAGLRSLPGFSLVKQVQEESFSPTSGSSFASGSEYFFTTVQSPRIPSGNARDSRSSYSEHEPSSESDRDRISKPSPVDRPEGYFPGMLSHKVSQEQSPAKPQPLAKGVSHVSRPDPHKKGQVLHSQGATFHSTHPSLPTATALPQSEDEDSGVDDKQGHPFKEPSMSLLRSMIDIGATQQFLAEPDSGKLLWVNSKFQAYRSTSPAQRLDDQLWDKIYHKDRKTFRREWTNALATGEQLSQQVRLERFDGQFRWFHIKFHPLKDKFSLIKHWHGQAMDIHDLHEAEVKAAKSKERAASEAKYRAIANSLPVIVFAASVPTGMTFANTQWLSYSGQSLEEALGFGFLDHVHPEDLTKCRFPGLGDPGVPSPKARGAFGRHPARLIRLDSATSSAGESEDTAVPETASSSHSIRSSSPLEELQIPSKLLRGLAHDGIILCAKDGQGNLSITTEMRLKSKDGKYRWHLVQGSYIESVDFGQGEAQWFIACTDISVQKQNEAKIQSTNSALEHMNSALEAEMQRKMGYLSSMSHEIRTPLNGILGNLQFLINSGLGESAGEWAHGAQDAAKSMHELINNILDLSKAEAKMLKLDTHWFNPRCVMEDVMDLLNSKAAEKKIELCHECAPNVPKTIRGDQGRIKQVLLNLAGNAIKFTKVGEVIVNCEVLDDIPSGFELPKLHDNELFIRWTIHDTGIGFSEEDRKLLFKAYSQVKSKNTRDISGTGLGLLICKTLVNLHGGEIDATSSGPGKGSAFSFFARFRVRKESLLHSQTVSALGTPAVGEGPRASTAAALSPGRRTDSPAQMPVAPSTQSSPALLSDSSSAPSFHSVMFQSSIRSSASTLDSNAADVAMKLTLPPNALISRSESGGARSPSSPTTAGGDPPSKHTSANLSLPKTGPLSPKTATISVEASTTSKSAPQRTGPPATKARVQKESEADSDPERSSFRPPMLSVLVVCPTEGTRRITCNRIQYVAPRSTPCNITSEASIEAALSLLLGEEPIFFTHVVIRITEDDVVARFLQQILASPRHAQICIVVVTDQGQESALKIINPELDFDALNKSDRVKMLLKPAHAHKLGKIFDPFSENAEKIEDVKEAKRKEEKRLQKESYTLFKRMLGGKGIRVIAVEDNKLQMNVSVPCRSITLLLLTISRSFTASLPRYVSSTSLKHGTARSV